jgi:hypothetical protein
MCELVISNSILQINAEKFHVSTPNASWARRKAKFLALFDAQSDEPGPFAKL